eukprot:5701432-Pyramimonas_sp.AAC.1
MSPGCLPASRMSPGCLPNVSRPPRCLPACLGSSCSYLIGRLLSNNRFVSGSTRMVTEITSIGGRMSDQSDLDGIELQASHGTRHSARHDFPQPKSGLLAAGGLWRAIWLA